MYFTERGGGGGGKGKNLLAEEEEARSVGAGHVLGHVAHLQVVDEAPEEHHETKEQEDPPEPILAIEVASEVVREPNDENPLDEGQAEATDGTVASCDGIGQTEGQAEANPVEQEGHEEGQHEDAVIPDTQLVGVAEVIPGRKVVIPWQHDVQG